MYRSISIIISYHFQYSIVVFSNIFTQNSNSALRVIQLCKTYNTDAGFNHRILSCDEAFELA